MKKHPLIDVLDQLYRLAQLQHDDAIKGKWLHDGDGCPGCGKDITEIKWKEKRAISLNTFKCGIHIHSEAAKVPYSRLPRHDEIEKNLEAAFVKHLGH